VSTHERKGPENVAGRISTREFAREPGKYVGRVETGASFELTRYNTTVAWLVPPHFSVSTTQAEPHIATSPQLRPAKQADPVQAQATDRDIEPGGVVSRKYVDGAEVAVTTSVEASRQQARTAQTQRDELLRVTRRGG
jgi:antitoxin (DNA-binding transcriptional repressor) of toxin-antitoxin stability system